MSFKNSIRAELFSGHKGDPSDTQAIDTLEFGLGGYRLRICAGGRKSCKHKGEEGSQRGHEPCERALGPRHRHLSAMERTKTGGILNTAEGRCQEKLCLGATYLPRERRFTLSNASSRRRMLRNAILVMWRRFYIGMASASPRPSRNRWSHGG